MRTLFCFALILSFSASFAQTGYRLDFHIKGWKDTTVYLGFYFGESNRICDTARVNSKGEFVFDRKTKLDQGIYYLVLNRSRIFDFVMGADQDFKMETDTADYIKYMKVTGDEDNTLFFQNQLFISDRVKEAMPFRKVLADTSASDDAKKKAREEFSKINDRVLAEQERVIKKHPDALTSRMFNSTRQVEIPPAPKKADGTIDSTFQLRWYREHFFDNFDLADDALIRMPTTIYQDKVKEYLDKLFLQNPDTITKAIAFMVSKARKNKDALKYLVHTCGYLYQSPEIMGLDQVFVNIYKQYFATGEMDYWANAQLKKVYKDLADKISLAQIGTTAPNLIMQDVNLKLRSMYDIKKKYTVVYFFDPDCGHCRQETPKLVAFYDKSKVRYDLEVYAVASDTSMQKLKSFIKEMKMTWITVDGPRTAIPTPYNKLYYTETYPSVFILDEKKKVIARKLPVDKIDLFLNNYEKMMLKTRKQL